MCPVIPTSNQDVREAKNRKRGDEILKKIFSETTEPMSGSPDTFLEGGHPRTIPPKFGCN
jgi:hypothetical protein